MFDAVTARSEVRAGIDRARSYLGERRAASTVFGLLLGASLLVWGVLLVATGGDRTPTIAAGGHVAVPDEGTGASPEPEPTGTPDGTTSTDETDAGPTEDQVTDASEGAERSTDETALDDPEPDDGETVLVELDGRCQVEVEAADAESGAPRAWEHPECEHAPLDPSRHDQRWIVVVGSYTGADNAEREARAWGDRLGPGPQVLWSSHYPSLNPDLWVVFGGPYPDRQTATAAADELGPGAYLRLLRVDGPSDVSPATG